MANSTWIFLDSPRMKGPAVRRWQEVLIALGYDIGSWGADGVFGPACEGATKAFQKSAGLSADGIVGGTTWAAAEVRMSTTLPRVAPSTQTTENEIQVLDYRGKIKPPKNGRHTRAWSDITGIVLHRTACEMGENPERYFTVNAHISVTLGGKIILCHPWEMAIWHSHGTSMWTVGIEFTGNPEGKVGYWWKPGGGPHPITDAQVKAADKLLEMLMAEFARNGQTIKYILAHRQSSRDRESDPGFDAWRKIAIPWMEKTGAIPGPREGCAVTKGLQEPVGYAGDTWGGPVSEGGGLQIPTEWDPRSKIPFWKE
ncbi:MAG: peptidoglycan-binding protein [Patescibacteria group bacterium]